MAMNIQPIKVDREKARDLYRSYKAHAHYSQPIDAELQRIYQLIAQGRVVVQAIASIIAAGLHPAGHVYAGLPKLAICRADAKVCHWRRNGNRTGGEFRADSARWNGSGRNRIVIPPASWDPAAISQDWSATSTPPLAPIHLRPKRGLANYHVLWEAEWRRVPPGDPMLLRRIGSADAWLVVAAWDLTDAEKAVMATRLNA